MLPTCDGPTRVLAEVILTLTLLLTVSTLAGAVGGFQRWPLIAALVGLSAVIHVVVRRPGPEPPESGPSLVTSTGAAEVGLLVVSVALLAGQWAPRVAAAVAHGITNQDSLKYHLTFAARFATTGWLTRIAQLGPEFPDAFHPANNEVLHALGMVAFGDDRLSPFLNLAWAAGVLLAGWCIGRPFGVAAVTAVAGAIVLAGPLITEVNAGSGSNDIAAIFCLLAAAAMLVQTIGTNSVTGALVVGGCAAGMGIGTKLTVVGPMAALTVGVIATGMSGNRLRRVGTWVVPMVMTGAFWYLRNWIRVGTPVPSIDLSVVGLPAPSFETVETFGFRVIDYADDRGVWTDWFFPGLQLAFGPLWALTLVLGALGTIAASLDRARERITRVLALTVAVGVTVYVVTPTTALGPPGKPILFASNLAYLTPSLLLSLALLPIAPAARQGRTRVVVTALMAVTLLSTTMARHSFRGTELSAWSGSYVPVAAVVALLAALVSLALLSLGPPDRRTLLAVALVTVIASAPVLSSTREGRYEHDERFRWAQSAKGARIAIAGFGPQYPLFGEDLQNSVQYVGEPGPNGEFHHVRSCTRWRAALRAGRYTHVQLRSEQHRVEETLLTWTNSDPAATRLEFGGKGTYLFAFDPSVPDGTGCTS